MFYADVLHGPLHGEMDPARTEAEVAARMDELARRIAAGDGDAARVTVRRIVERSVYPAPAVLEYAASHDVDVIVTGTHARRGISRLVLGSVAEEIVRHAGCAVLTVPTSEEERSGRIDVTSLLVPFDFSMHSRNALANAKELAAAFGARIDMLHVVEERLHPAFYGIAVQSVYDVEPEIESKAVDHMRAAYDSAVGPDGPVSFEARPGSAAREIVDFAGDVGSSMIIMGTHGLTGLDHFLLGSTTERVLRRASTPVFALKHAGRSLMGGRPDSEGTTPSEHGLSSPESSASAP